MVTLEESLKDSEEFNQQRRSLVAAAIRRGEARISEPILWVEGVPPNQRPVSAVVEQEPELQSAAGDQDTEDNDQTRGLAISTDEPRVQSALALGDVPGDGPTLNHKKSVSDGNRHTVESQAIFSPRDTVDEKSEHKRSIFVEDEMGNPSPQSQEKKKARRSGTLRGVLRKVFKRKEKTQSKEVPAPQPADTEIRPSTKHEYSRSDPLPPTTPIIRQDRDIGSQNAMYTFREGGTDSRGPHTPVQQTLPFPMNVNAPLPESPVQERMRANYLSFETSARVHRRRATLPSIVISPDESTTLHKMWSTTDLTPIGSASDKSGIGSFSLPSPPVGIALSSTVPQPNRRSRSAGALHELAKHQAGSAHIRNRSSEIKYWQATKKDSQQDVRPTILPDPSPDLRSTRESSVTQAQTEVSEVFAETGSSIHSGHLEPLDFVSVTSDPVVEESHEDSMEQRLLQLESTMHRLSMSVQEYATKTEPPKEREFALKPAPKTNTPQVVFVEPAPVPEASTATITETTPQRMPSMRYQQPRTVPSPSPSKGSYQQSYLSSTSTAAASSSPQATYLQPYGHLPAPTSVHSAPQIYETADGQYVTLATLQEHIKPLYNALRYERQIRKQFEAQVSQLRQDVVELSTIVAQMRKQAAYAQSTSNGSARSSPHKGFGAHVTGEMSRFSGYDSSDDEEHIDAPMRSPQEQWTTPMEEHSRQWGSTVEGDMF